jgi:hypothetical protein
MENLDKPISPTIASKRTGSAGKVHLRIKSEGRERERERKSKGGQLKVQHYTNCSLNHPPKDTWFTNASVKNLSFDKVIDSLMPLSHPHSCYFRIE